MNRKTIQTKINFWRKHLELNPKWDIKFSLYESSLQMPEDARHMEACIDVDLAYFNATLELNGPMLNEKNIDNVLVHELLHILVEPLDNFALMAIPEKYHDQIRIHAESMIENLIPGIMNGAK